MTADEFNKQFHEGQPVYYDNDFGVGEECYLRSQAWELGSGQVIVKVTGRTGGVLCDRIRERIE